MTDFTATSVQRSNSAIQVRWDAIPDTEFQWAIRRFVNLEPVDIIALVRDFQAREWVDTNPPPTVGDTVRYSVTDDTTGDIGEGNTLTIRDLEVPFTFGTIDALVDTIRYTTLIDVKRRLGLLVTDTTNDDLITQSTVAAEIQIDQMNGRSFPDTGANPEWPGIPEPIASWATDAAVAVYKRADAPFGTAGSENWIGTLDVADEVERALRRNPLAVGYKVSFGIGFQANRVVV